MSLMVDFPIDTLAKTLTCSKRSPRPSKTVRRRVLQDTCPEEPEKFISTTQKTLTGISVRVEEVIEDLVHNVPLWWDSTDEIIEDSCLNISLVMEYKEDESSSPSRDLEEDFELAVDTYMREKQFSIQSNSSLSRPAPDYSAARQVVRTKTDVSPTKAKGSPRTKSTKQKARKRTGDSEAQSETSYSPEKAVQRESWIPGPYLPHSMPSTLGINLNEQKPESGKLKGEHTDRSSTTHGNISDAMTEEFLRITEAQLNAETMIQKRRLSSNSDASSGSQKKRTKTLSSRFRGVSKCTKDGRWQARIRIGSVVKYLGRFKDEVEAAHCYDVAAHQYHGSRAMPNFGPDGECLIDKREDENKLSRTDDSEDEKGFTDASKE